MDYLSTVTHLHAYMHTCSRQNRHQSSITSQLLQGQWAISGGPEKVPNRGMETPSAARGTDRGAWNGGADITTELNAECHKTDRLLVVDGVLAGDVGETGCTSVLSRRCTSIVPAEVVFGSLSRHFPSRP